MLGGRKIRVELGKSRDHAYGCSSGVISSGRPRGSNNAGTTVLPRTPTGVEAAMTRALALGVSGSTIVQIFDPQTLKNVELLGQPPLVAAACPNLKYCAPPYAQYSPYGNALNMPDAGCSDRSIYSPMSTAHGPMSLVPYNSMMHAHYPSPSYQMPSYAYVTVAGRSNEQALENVRIQVGSGGGPTF